MRKINSFLLLLFCIVINNLANSQTIKTVFTIGSSYAPPGTCYPATPEPIRPPSGTTANNNSSSDPQVNQTNSFLVTTTNVDYTAIFTTAYARGFRHFLFQEGLYIVSNPIDLKGLNGITIEGSGASTVFKPSSPSLTTIFDVKNCSNGKIINLGIDLKTTLVCGDFLNDQDINTGIKIGNKVGRCLFEGIFFRSNIAPLNATVIGSSPILIELIAGQ